MTPKKLVALLALVLVPGTARADLDPLLDWLANKGAVPANGELVTGSVGVRVVGAGSPQAQAALVALGAVVRPAVPGGRAFAAEIPLAKLVAAGAIPGLQLRAATRLHPSLDASVRDMSVPHEQPPYAQGALTGKNVVVGVVDTGVDLDHADLKDENGASRVKALWDQSTGREYRGTAVASSGVKDDEGHGTHVASTAAGSGAATGNGAAPYRYVGLAPRADLVVVKTTFDTTAILDGVRWCFEQAGQQSAVVNLSLGGHYGPHDGSDPLDVGIDELVGAKSGRAVVVAAGNEYGSRVHANRASGSTATFTLSIGDYTPKSGARNDAFLLDAWHPKEDRVRVVVTSPRGSVARFDPGTSNDVTTNDGGIYCSNAKTSSAADGAREVVVQIYDESESVPPRKGDWKIALEPVTTASRGGRIDAWVASGAGWAKLSDGDDDCSVGSPGDAKKAITVAAYVTKTSWRTESGNSYGYSSGFTIGEIAPFSSAGPTRDGRNKPDIAAPGAGIGAARSTAAKFPTNIILEDGVHVLLQGTSMATPHVAGLVALLFEKQGAVSTDQVASALRSSARRASGPATRWGAGKADYAATGAATGAPPPPPQGAGYRITTRSLPPAQMGSAYLARVETADAAGPSRFSVKSGTLPPGIALAPDGTIAGTPLATGPFSFTIAADDLALEHAEAPLSIQVLPVGANPTPPITFRVKTTDLPRGARGVAYVAKVEVEGGSPPYSFSLVASALPKGLELHSGGAVDGTPLVDGAFSFRVRATDSTGATADGDLRVQVDRGSQRLALVQSIDLEIRDSWFQWYVRSRVRIVDETGAPVGGATLQLKFSGKVSASRSATTDANGVATIDSPRGGFGDSRVEATSIDGSGLFTDVDRWTIRARTASIRWSLWNIVRLIF